MKKINLIIFPGNFLPHIGGLETHVDEFVKYLSKDKKYNISIFVPNVVNAKEKEIIHNNVQVIRYPAIEIVANFPFPKIWNSRFWSLLFSLYKTKYDIVMTRTMFFTNSTLGMFFAKFRFKRIKLIHVEHGSDYSKLDSKFKLFVNKIYMKTLGNLLLLFSDKLVGVSDASKYFLLNNFFIKKSLKDILVIRRGFDFKKVELIKPNLEIKNQYKNKKIITFVGRLIDGKGVQDVLKALQGIDKNYIFLIIGEGIYKEKLLVLVKQYNLESNVKFLGRLPHNKVISILKASDLFINPSYTEGLPTSVLDAIFSGTKVIATDVGGTYEILEDYWKNSGYDLIPANNIPKLENSIKNILKIKQFVHLRVIQHVKNRFDWENHKQNYKLILNNLI